MSKYHVVLRGPRRGRWDKCSAQEKCRNGSSHVDGYVLESALLYAKELEPSRRVSLSSLKVSDVKKFSEADDDIKGAMHTTSSVNNVYKVDRKRLKAKHSSYERDFPVLDFEKSLTKTHVVTVEGYNIKRASYTTGQYEAATDYSNNIKDVVARWREHGLDGREARALILLIKSAGVDKNWVEERVSFTKFERALRQKPSDFAGDPTMHAPEVYSPKIVESLINEAFSRAQDVRFGYVMGEYGRYKNALKKHRLGGRPLSV